MMLSHGSKIESNRIDQKIIACSSSNVDRIIIQREIRSYYNSDPSEEKETAREGIEKAARGQTSLFSPIFPQGLTTLKEVWGYPRAGR